MAARRARGGVLRADGRDRAAVDDRAAGARSCAASATAGCWCRWSRVLVAITLLPVILASIGPRLDWPPAADRAAAVAGVLRWAALVYRHRWASAAAGAGDHGRADGCPRCRCTWASPGASAEATAGPAHDALATLTSGGVPSGVITPAEVLTSGPAAAPRSPRGPRGCPACTRRSPRSGAGFARDGGTAIVDVLPAHESSLPAGQAAIAVDRARAGRQPGRHRGRRGRRVADRLRPRGVRGLPADAHADRDRDVPPAGAGVPLGVLAAKAVVFNLISLAAAYGVMTWVFQDGHGSRRSSGSRPPARSRCGCR